MQEDGGDDRTGASKKKNSGDDAMKSYHLVVGELLHQTDIVSSKWNAVIITSMIYW